MKNKKTTFWRILPLFMAMALCITSQGVTAFAQTADTDAPQAQGEDISPGDIISFGSYPQTEVTGNALTNEIIEAEYDENGDAVVDGQKYRRYKEAVKVTKEDYKTYVETYHPEDSSYDDYYWSNLYTNFCNGIHLNECEKKKTEEQGTYRYFKWEPVKWKVLENETEEGTLFVMADTVLDAGNYAGEYRSFPKTVSWEESDLCQWMNTDDAGFYETAFNKSEKENIKVSDRNPGGEPIYLLSDEEVKNTDYGFENTDRDSKSRVMYASAYAQARGAAVYNKSDLRCSWFLRTPGQIYYVKNVSLYGGIYDNKVEYYQNYQWNPNTSTYERTFKGCVPVMHIDASSVEQVQDPEPGKPGVANLDYTFTAVDGTPVSTTSEPGQATVIVFGNTECTNTKNTLRSIAASSMVNRPDIRVIFAETYGASAEEVQSYVTEATYGGGENIILCYDENSGLNSAMRRYYGLFHSAGMFVSPAVVLIDGENRVHDCLTGYQPAFQIMDQMKDFVEQDEGEKTVSVKFAGTRNYDYAWEILNLVNEARAKNELPELQLDSALMTTAMYRAKEIALYYSHTRPTGASFDSASNRGTRKLENIAAGQLTPEAVMNAWLNSAGHYANIMDSRVTSIGIGCFRDSQGVYYWVQYFDNETAETPSVTGQKTYIETVSIQKKFLHLHTNASRTFNETDKGTTFTMEVWQENEGFPGGSRPRLSASGLSFSSSDTNVATVDVNGKITLMRPGTAVITASLKEDDSVKVEQTITILQNAPVETSIPEQTANPVETSIPEQTAKPIESSVPEQTAKPIESSVPEQTVKPIETSVPEQTLKPIETSAPEQTVKPIESSAPEQTVKPIETSAPEQTAKPIESSAPEQTVKPIESSVPEQTVKPIESSVPEQTVKPIGSSVPEQTAKPIESSVPEQTVKPIQSSMPGTPTTPSQEPAQRELPAENSMIRDASGNTYQVTQSGEVNGTVAFVKAKDNQAATANVPSKVTIDNITYQVTSISAKAFYGNTKLKKVNIGKNVTSIGNSAFEGCTALKSIVIPAKVRSIGKNAFKNCKKLKSIKIKGNVLKTVGKNAFKGIHAKAKIKVPKKQLKAYQKLLKGKGQKKTVKITK